MSILKRLFPQRTRLTKDDKFIILRTLELITRDDKNIILRALELKMEELEPEHKTVLEKRMWLSNASTEFIQAKAAYDKLYNYYPDGNLAKATYDKISTHKPNGEVF